MLTIGVDFFAGSRFAVPGIDGIHPAHDTVTKRYRHLNFFQHGCYLEAPRVRLPDGGIHLVEPDWAGKLAGFTLLLEALISKAVDKTRRIEQKTDPSLKGLRWTLLKDREELSPAAQADLDALVA